MVLFSALLFGCDHNSPNWDSVNTTLVNDYPDVQHISTDVFADKHQGNALLIDVREANEYAISHIPGAINLTTATVIADYVKTQDKQAVVVYCSVGYRSAAMARELAQNGVHNALNLQGSIFAWANEGRQLVDDNEVTDKVHPYNDHWGKLLDDTVPVAYQ